MVRGWRGVVVRGWMGCCGEGLDGVVVTRS